jgi:hypothetical protein
LYCESLCHSNFNQTKIKNSNVNYTNKVGLRRVVLSSIKVLFLWMTFPKDESHMDFFKTCLFLKNIVNLFFATTFEWHNKHLLFSWGLVLCSTSNYYQVILQFENIKTFNVQFFKIFPWKAFCKNPTNAKCIQQHERLSSSSSKQFPFILLLTIYQHGFLEDGDVMSVL